MENVYVIVFPRWRVTDTSSRLGFWLFGPMSSTTSGSDIDNDRSGTQDGDVLSWYNVEILIEDMTENVGFRYARRHSVSTK